MPCWGAAGFFMAMQSQKLDRISIGLYTSLLNVATMLYGTQVTKLELDNCSGGNVASLSDKFVNLEELTMVNSNVRTLNGFPALPKLTKVF